MRISSPETVENRLPELDGIRGLAILAVLLSHGAGLTGIFDAKSAGIYARLFRFMAIPLWGGVDLFFVLSGFLITGILLRTRDSENYFYSFYARRILRIFPIYYLVLIATLSASRYSLLVSSLLPPFDDWRVAHFLYIQNWPHFWHGNSMLSGIWGPYWSLAVEEQFYLVWPFVVWAVPKRRLLLCCVIGIAFALPLRLLLCHHVFRGGFGLAQLTSSRVDGLLAGAACAIYTDQNERPVPPRYLGAIFLLGVLIMGYILLWHPVEFLATDRWMTTIGITGYACLSTALVALSQDHPPVLQHFLTTSWLRTVGKYSYGIYVYHLMVFLFARYWYVDTPAGNWARGNFAFGLAVLLAECATVFMLAKMSYDLIEIRFLRFKRHFPACQ